MQFVPHQFVDGQPAHLGNEIQTILHGKQAGIKRARCCDCSKNHGPPQAHGAREAEQTRGDQRNHRCQIPQAEPVAVPCEHPADQYDLRSNGEQEGCEQTRTAAEADDETGHAQRGDRCPGEPSVEGRKQNVEGEDGREGDESFSLRDRQPCAVDLPPFEQLRYQHHGKRDGTRGAGGGPFLEGAAAYGA